MQTSALLKHIHEINLSYLLLASSLINHDKPSAMFRLGVCEDIAILLGKLTLTQMSKLSQTNQLICKFRFTDEHSIFCLTQESRVDGLKQVHTGILLSTHLMNEMSDVSDEGKKNR